MPVGGGFARFSRMPLPRKEGDAVESVNKEAPVDSEVDSSMQPWTNSNVDEGPNDFGDDFGLPMDNLGGGMDFDNNVDDSMMGGWGETEASTLVVGTDTVVTTDTDSDKRPTSGISLFKRQPTAVSLGTSMMMNPPAVTTPKPSRAAVLPVGTAPLAAAREVTPHAMGKDMSNHSGVSRPNSGRHNVLENATNLKDNSNHSGVSRPNSGSHNVLENVTNLQLAKKVAHAGESGVAQTGLKPASSDIKKTPPPPSNFVRPAFMATHKTIPSKTPAKTPTKTPVKTSQPIAASIQVTAEKERVVPFSSMNVSRYPPEKPVLPHEEYINVSAGVTVSTGEEAGVSMEKDSESFDVLHEAFISKIRDFGYKEASYSQALLDMNLLLGISHAEMLRTQADGLDLTERMETMSLDIDDFLRDCMKS